jgi:hypothetical protein
VLNIGVNPLLMIWAAFSDDVNNSCVPKKFVGNAIDALSFSVKSQRKSLFFVCGSLDIMRIEMGSTDAPIRRLANRWWTSTADAKGPGPSLS